MTLEFVRRSLHGFTVLLLTPVLVVGADITTVTHTRDVTIWIGTLAVVGAPASNVDLVQLSDTISFSVASGICGDPKVDARVCKRLGPFVDSQADIEWVLGQPQNLPAQQNLSNAISAQGALLDKTHGSGTLTVTPAVNLGTATYTIATWTTGTPQVDHIGNARVTIYQMNATWTAPGSGNGGCTLSAPAITSIASLTDFGSFTTFNSGSWLEIKGTNLATGTRLWEGRDFQGSKAPTSLDGTSVSVNGKPAFMYYISRTQVNVQVPADAALGFVPVTVTNCAGASAAVTAQKTALAAGILAPASFKIGGKQYAVAQYADLTFVGNPNLIAGATFRPGKPGDRITIYGIGFGEVTPAWGPGIVVGQQNSIDGLTIRFGETLATFTYAGLSPGLIGLYQFDIMVPEVPDGDAQIHFNVRGTEVAQTLYLTVKR
jgi:uncharacterized protein (TIGR03437 family)